MNIVPTNEQLMVSKEHSTRSMGNLANNNINLQYGQVYARDDNKFAVTTMDESCWLPLAASCMIEPAIGDTVLFTSPGNQGYILAVLQRADSQSPASIHLPKNSSINVNSLKIKTGLLQAEGNTNVSSWRQQTVITGNYNSFSNHINIKANSRKTKITGHDELHANSKRIVIAKDWRVRAQDSDIRAKRQASIDGEQVRLG